MHKARIANSNDLVSTNFAKTGNLTRILDYFSSERLLLNLKTVALEFLSSVTRSTVLI